MTTQVKSTPPRTPSPWHLESKGWDGLFIRGNDERVPGGNRLIAEASLMYDGAEANAAHIVRCVNSHEALVRIAELVQHAAQNRADRDWTQFHLDLSEAAELAKQVAPLAAAGAPQ